jgi:hypothetical protein
VIQTNSVDSTTESLSYNRRKAVMENQTFVPPFQAARSKGTRLLVVIVAWLSVSVGSQRLSGTHSRIVDPNVPPKAPDAIIFSSNFNFKGRSDFRGLKRSRPKLVLPMCHSIDRHEPNAPCKLIRYICSNVEINLQRCLSSETGRIELTGGCVLISISAAAHFCSRAHSTRMHLEISAHRRSTLTR